MTKDKAIKELWQIIDNIDTISDIAKDNNEVYRRLVEKEQSKRWNIPIETNGYGLDLTKLDSGCATLHPLVASLFLKENDCFKSSKDNIIYSVRYTGTKYIKYKIVKMFQLGLFKIGIKWHDTIFNECTPDFECCRFEPNKA